MPDDDLAKIVLVLLLIACAVGVVIVVYFGPTLR